MPRETLFEVPVPVKCALKTNATPNRLWKADAGITAAPYQLAQEGASRQAAPAPLASIHRLTRTDAGAAST